MKNVKEVYDDLSKTELGWLYRAVDMAKNSECRQKHGAVIVRGGSMVAAACNTYRNHPSILSPEHIATGAHRHAEYVALASLRFNAVGCTIYVARVNKQDKIRLSRPCRACYDWIFSAGIRKVVYTV